VEVARPHVANQEVLGGWTARLRAETGDGFPARVTGLRASFATHGRQGEPYPVCGTPISRIVCNESVKPTPPTFSVTRKTGKS